MSLSRVTQGVITQELIYGSYFQSPLMLAWMLCPPLDMDLAVRVSMTYGIQELRNIIGMDDNSAKTATIKIGALRILGEMAGLLTTTGKIVKQKGKKVVETKAEIRAVTEADIEERKRLIEKKMQNRGDSGNQGT